MRGRSIGYLTREGFKNIWVNRLLSLATVLVLVSCLVIVGTGTLIFFNINEVLDVIEDQNVIKVFIDDSASEYEKDILKVQLLDMSNVDDVEFVSREEGFEEVLATYGENADIMREGLSADILPDAFRVTVENIDDFDKTVAEIRLLDNVLHIQENSELAGKIAKIRDAVSYISIGIVAVLFFVSLFIVANTIRITIFNRRLEISIMKAVGATNAFIRWPFIVEGILLGIFSAVVGLGIQYGVYSVASIWLGDILNMIGGQVIPFMDYIWIILGMFAFIGVFIGAFGSILSLNKYLKEHNNVVENK